MVTVLLLFRIALLLSSSAFTRSNVIPCTVVLAGYSTTIGCNSSGMINLRHKSLDGYNSIVYASGKITSSYAARGCRMETTHEFGTSTLAILNATTDLAGKYECEIFDNGEIVRKEEIELIILDPVSGRIANKIGLQTCEVLCQQSNKACPVFPNCAEVIPSKSTTNHSVEPKEERENDTESSASKQLIDTQKPVLEKENEHWAPSTINLLILGILSCVAFAIYLFTRMRRKRMFARERIPTCEQGSQTDESSMYSTTNV